MFSFGSNLLLDNLAGSLVQNINVMIIGRIYSADSLGFYSRAKSFQNISLGSLTQVINRVTFPVFSVLQENPSKLKNGLNEVNSTMVLLIFPLCLIVINFSDFLIPFLLTSKWAPCVPYFKLFMVIGMLWPFQSVNLNIIKSLGDGRLYLKLGILMKATFILSILLTYRIGVMEMVIGQVLQSLFCTIVNISFAGRLINFSLFQQIKEIFPILVITFLLYLLLTAGEFLLSSLHPIVSLLIRFFFAIIFLLTIYQLIKFPAYIKIKNTTLSIITKRIKR